MVKADICVDFNDTEHKRATIEVYRRSSPAKTIEKLCRKLDKANYETVVVVSLNNELSEIHDVKLIRLLEAGWMKLMEEMLNEMKKDEEMANQKREEDEKKSQEAKEEDNPISNF